MAHWLTADFEFPHLYCSLDLLLMGPSFMNDPSPTPSNHFIALALQARFWHGLGKTSATLSISLADSLWLAIFNYPLDPQKLHSCALSGNSLICCNACEVANEDLLPRVVKVFCFIFFAQKKNRAEQMVSSETDSSDTMQTVSTFVQVNVMLTIHHFLLWRRIKLAQMQRMKQNLNCKEHIKSRSVFTRKDSACSLWWPVGFKEVKLRQPDSFLLKDFTFFVINFGHNFTCLSSFLYMHFFHFSLFRCTEPDIWHGYNK